MNDDELKANWLDICGAIPFGHPAAKAADRIVSEHQNLRKKFEQLVQDLTYIELDIRHYSVFADIHSRVKNLLRKYDETL